MRGEVGSTLLTNNSFCKRIREREREREYIRERAGEWEKEIANALIKLVGAV